MQKVFFLLTLFFIASCKKDNDKTNPDNYVINKIQEAKDSINLKNNLNSVDKIRKEYNLVNSQLVAKKLDSVSFGYECEERTGNVIYYSENGNLKLIKHFQADSHFSSTESYFVNDGKPYFIFKNETIWSFDGGTPEKPITKDDVTEQRFYIIENKSVQCFEKKYTIKSNSINNSKSENIPNKKMKNCSIAELQKSFDLLMKNKYRKADGKCLEF